MMSYFLASKYKLSTAEIADSNVPLNSALDTVLSTRYYVKSWICSTLLLSPCYIHDAIPQFYKLANWSLQGLVPIDTLDSKDTNT